MHALQEAREKRFEADAAVARFGEGEAFVFRRLRLMRGDDEIDDAVAECLHERLPVVFGAQRRAHLEVGPGSCRCRSR